MVKITHQGDNIEKAVAILAAAQKRFGIYGLEKTSMHEIASDLDMSKGALYYYFPDKEELYKAVVAMEQQQFVETIKTEIENTEDPAKMLHQYAHLRLDYFRKLANLSRMRMAEFNSMKKFLGAIWEAFNATENGIISGIIELGVQKKIFFSSDIRSDASLYLEILRGLRFMSMKNKEQLYLEEEEYTLLRKKLSRFTEMFINGLEINKGI
jgi:AcrR family transcriptional regulator